MKVIRTKIAALVSPENMPFPVPTVMPTNPKEIELLENQVISGLKNPDGPLYYGYVPKEIRESKNPKMIPVLYGAKKFWNNYVKERPTDYKYLQPAVKELLTPTTMYNIVNYFAYIILNDINQGDIGSANSRLKYSPTDISNKVQERVIRQLVNDNVNVHNVPDIIRKRFKQLKRRK